jgi:hypothetical protein
MITYTDDEVEEARRTEIDDILKAHEVSLEEVFARYQNQYGAREALHTAYIFGENVSGYLARHPCVALDPEAYRFAHAAMTALFNLYQRIGAIEESFRSAEETAESEE